VDWRFGSSDTAPALQASSPEFKPQSHLTPPPPKSWVYQLGSLIWFFFCCCCCCCFLTKTSLFFSLQKKQTLLFPE
jgi:hypothetical protein